MNTAMRAGLFGAAALLVLVAAGTAAAAIYVVSPDGSGDFPNIQDAVDAAKDGDVVRLTDGVFSGHGNRDVVVPQREFWIWSESGDPTACIIDCEGAPGDEHRAFHFVSSVPYTIGATLRGVGIINGYTTTGGGGVWIEGVGACLIDCTITGCTAAGESAMGGGLYTSGECSPYIDRCLIAENSAAYGGGVAFDAGFGTIYNCEISGNVATEVGGGVWRSSSGYRLYIEQSDIVDNSAPVAGGVVATGTTLIHHTNISRNEATAGWAGGIWLQEDGRAQHCTIVDNSATEEAGGVYCDEGTGELLYTIIAFTSGGVGVGASEGNEPEFYCCDVYGNVDGDYCAVIGDQTGVNFTFSADPEFCDLEGGNYELLDTSPCLGNDPCGRVGAFEQGCISPVEEMSWGRVKGLWR